MMYGGHAGIGMLLLTSVAGYWVLERSSTHKGNLKRIGEVLGVAIIVMSILGVACQIWCAAKCPDGAMMRSGGAFCPFSSKPQ